MCLNTIKSTHPGTSKEVKVGYKWFKSSWHDECVSGPCRGGVLRKYIWHNAEKILLWSRDDRKTYWSGFHIFTSKTAANKHWLSSKGYSLYEVEYRNVTTKGIDSKASCEIALQMRIKRRVK